jgi:hypothetical protein
MVSVVQMSKNQGSPILSYTILSRTYRLLLMADVMLFAEKGAEI